MNRSTVALSVSVSVFAACATHPGGASSPSSPSSMPAGSLVEAPASLDDGHVTYDEYQGSEATVQDSLRRLAALDVLTVGQLIVDAPSGSQNCYGPCEDDAVAQAWMQVHAVQAARLAALVDAAEAVADQGPAGDPSAVDDDVDALRERQIVEIDGMREGPADRTVCYTDPCPDDAARAGVIAGLAAKAPRL